MRGERQVAKSIPIESAFGGDSNGVRRPPVSLVQSGPTNKITGKIMKGAFLLSYLNSMGDWKCYLYLI